MRSTFAVRETASLAIMGAHRVPPLCRETQSLGQQMLNAPFGINGLTLRGFRESPHTGGTHDCSERRQSLGQLFICTSDRCFSSSLETGKKRFFNKRLRKYSRKYETILSLKPFYEVILKQAKAPGTMSLYNRLLIETIDC